MFRAPLPIGAMLKALYSPIYFTKPAAEPMDVLRKRLAQYGPVRVGNGGAEWMSSLDGSEALVADISGSDTTVGAEVAYALHKCRIPVLCLRRRGASAVRAIETSVHPLLTCHEYADDSSAASAIADFLTPPTSPGRIFVVEGGDGAGKQTQTALLRDRLTGMGYPVSTIDFPHDAAMHGPSSPAVPAARDLVGCDSTREPCFPPAAESARSPPARPLPPAKAVTQITGCYAVMVERPTCARLLLGLQIHAARDPRSLSAQAS
jgi:dTMP kinase